MNSENNFLFYSVDKFGIETYKNIFGKLSRTNGPAWIEKNHKNKAISYEVWYSDGLRHNDSGPAEISYNHEGKIIYQAFYLCGVQVTESEITNLNHL